MTVFERLDAVASTTLLAMHGEEAVVWPQAKGGYAGPTVDADRMPVQVRGILSVAPEFIALMDDRPGGGVRTSAQTMTARTSFWIAAQDAMALGWRPRDGDRLELPARGRTYDVVSIGLGLPGDLRLILAAGDRI